MAVVIYYRLSDLLSVVFLVWSDPLGGSCQSIYFPGLCFSHRHLGGKPGLGLETAFLRACLPKFWRSLAELCGVSSTKALPYEIVKKRRDLFRQFLENLRRIPTLTAPLK